MPDPALYPAGPEYIPSDDIETTPTGTDVVETYDATTYERKAISITNMIKRQVEAHTADDTLTAAETGTVHTTVGASATVTFTLPAAVEGLEYFFRVGAAQELRIDPDGTETIALPDTGVQGAAGKYLTANADGETVRILCDNDGEWSVYGFTGTWTHEA